MISKNAKYKRYCDDIAKIEGYEEAVSSPEKYVIHHRREVQNGVQIWTRHELINIGHYFNVDASDLIFMKQKDHTSLHKNAYDPKRKCLCKVMTDEQKDKLSKAHQGRAPWNKGKTGVQCWSEKSKEKLRKTLAKPEVKAKMYTEERNRKIANSRLGNKYPRANS